MTATILNILAELYRYMGDYATAAYKSIVLYAHASFLFPPLQKTTVFAG